MTEFRFDDADDHDEWPEADRRQLEHSVLTRTQSSTSDTSGKFPVGDADNQDTPDGLQLTLGEMFLLITLTAVGLWLYQFIDPLLAMLCGGAVLFFAIMKSVGRRPLVVGGLIGCAAAFGIALLIGVLCDASVPTFAGLLAISPCCGYIVGGAITELNGDDEF